MTSPLHPVPKRPRSTSPLLDVLELEAKQKSQKPDLSLDEARVLLRLQQHLDLISEDVFQRVIITDAPALGWLVHAERPARSDKGWRTPVQGDAGFFDLTLCRNGRVVFLECKSEKGKLSKAQMKWQKAALLNAFIVRPSDWDWIERELA